MKTSYLLRHLAGSLFFFSLIFISAGRLDYRQGLVYVSIGLIMFILNYTLLKVDPELLKERSAPGINKKSWDKPVLGLSFLCTILMYISAGLDSGRYHSSPEFPPVFFILGIVLTAGGQLLFLIAQKENRFFSSTMRIQTERGHTVCDTGVYRFVRHPAYFGSLVQTFGFPLLFGSLWSLIPAGMMIILLFIRTRLEDMALHAELQGYPQYSEKTRYRLIPFVW